MVDVFGVVDFVGSLFVIIGVEDVELNSGVVGFEVAVILLVVFDVVVDLKFKKKS